MGLQVLDAINGIYRYGDKFGSVIYRQLFTGSHYVQDVETFDGIDTSQVEIPYLAVFTRGPEEEEHKYCGIVSRIYRFIGNEILNNIVRESVRNTGMPVVAENTYLSDKRTMMRNEFIMSNSARTKVGDVLPVVVIRNSYDGTWAQAMQFGINFPHYELSFAFRMGEVRQIHVAGATTSMSSFMEGYFNTFADNISNVLRDSFEKQFTEEQLMSLLDIIEDTGKRKRRGISEIIQEVTPEGQVLPSAWHVFLAIVRYTSTEPNLNTKAILENIAESVLVIPTRMASVMERMSRGILPEGQEDAA
jgi:hypothetical protein